jgi:hypothetical protein
VSFWFSVRLFFDIKKLGMLIDTNYSIVRWVPPHRATNKEGHIMKEFSTASVRNYRPCVTQQLRQDHAHRSVSALHRAPPPLGRIEDGTTVSDFDDEEHRSWDILIHFC